MNEPESVNRRDHTLGRLDRWVERLEKFVLITGVLAMAALNIANVISRTLLNNSLTFAEEINQGLIVLVTFIGIGYGVRCGRHIRMSAFYDQLAGRARKALMMMICAGTAILLFLLAGFACMHIWNLYQSGSVTSALRIPLFLLQICVPIGLALGGVQYVLAFIRNLVSEGTWLSFTEPDTYHHTGQGGL